MSQVMAPTRCPVCGGQPQPRDARSALCPACGLLLNRDSRPLDYAEGGGQAVPDAAKMRWRLENAKRRLKLVEPFLAGHEVLVDIGCGSGEMLEAGRGRFAHCVGFDTNKPLIRHIAAQGRAVAIEGHFDAKRIPAELRGRPTVFALSHVLEHLPEPAGLMAQIAAAMGPGDLLYVEVPLHTGESFRRQGYGWNLWNAEHLALYGPRTLAVLAGRAGLAVLDGGSRIFARGSHSTKTRLRLLRRAPAAFLRAALTKPRRLSIADVMVGDYGYAVLRKP